MAFTSGTAEVGGDPVPLSGAGQAGVRVKNLGGTRVFVGGPDVSTDGYPLEPGASEVFYGGIPKEIAVVPAPPHDAADPVLYACTDGSGVSRVSWIGA